MHLTPTRRHMLALLGGTACALPLPAFAAPSDDAAFDAIAARWLDGYARLSPVNATRLGDHRFDGEIDAIDDAARVRKLAFSKGLLADIAALDRARLSRAARVDSAILANQLRRDVWQIETLQDWAWDPLVYSDLAGGALYNLMARDFAPLPDRLRSATARMYKLPAFLSAVRAQLVPARVPKIHAETLAKQNPGLASIIDDAILKAAWDGAYSDPALTAAAQRAKAAIAEHQTWIEATLVPQADGDYRLGAKLFDAKLAFDLDTPVTRTELRRRAEAEKARLRGEMYALAAQVLTGRRGAPATPAAPTPAQQQAAIAAALRIASDDRPARGDLVATARRTLDQATAFVRAKDLITLPAAAVKVIVMPEFQQGVAVAYCDPPGALERGLDTFYAVSPIPKDWSGAQATSFLREYSNRGIHEITVHEAMPGHYVQLAHANQYKSVIRAALYSGPFVEGWAVYAQDLMAEQGYLARDPLYLLVHLKLQLRAATNAILDQAIHADGIGEAEAMALMTEGAFQEEREASGKWVRARVSSAQLSTYFVGWQAHLAMRREAETRPGFDLKRYHDAVLAFGSPAPRHAKALLFDEAIA